MTENIPEKLGIPDDHSEHADDFENIVLDLLLKKNYQQADAILDILKILNFEPTVDNKRIAWAAFMTGRVFQKHYGKI